MTQPYYLTLSIRALSFQMHVGVHPWERNITQTISIDATFQYDATKAVLSDSIEGAINYDVLVEDIQTFSKALHPQLIETFACRLADHLMARYPFLWLQLNIQKPAAIPAANAIEVCVDRGMRVVTNVNSK